MSSPPLDAARNPAPPAPAGFWRRFAAWLDGPRWRWLAVGFILQPVFAGAGIVLYNIGLAWIMFLVMDDY